MPGKAAKYFIGSPETCDMCNRRIVGVFYDAATQMGPWANMCPECFAELGRGLGPGRGQEYTQQKDERWMKTGG